MSTPHEATIGERSKMSLPMVFTLIGATAIVAFSLGGYSGSKVTSGDLAAAVKEASATTVSNAVFAEYKSTVSANFETASTATRSLQTSLDRVTQDLADLRRDGALQAQEFRTNMQRLEDLVRDLQARSTYGNPTDRK